MGRVILLCCLLLNCLGNSLLAEPIKIGLNYPRTGNYKAEGLELHRYSLLKGPQQWRAFDHQNVQSIYAVRVKTRGQIMQDLLKQDYFEIIHPVSGEAAAPSHDDWQQERGEQLTLH